MPASWVSVEVRISDRVVAVTVDEGSTCPVCARSECAHWVRCFGAVLRRPMIGICVVCVASVLVCRTRGVVPSVHSKILFRVVRRLDRNPVRVPLSCQTNSSSVFVHIFRLVRRLVGVGIWPVVRMSWLRSSCLDDPCDWLVLSWTTSCIALVVYQGLVRCLRKHSPTL